MKVEGGGGGGGSGGGEGGKEEGRGRREGGDLGSSAIKHVPYLTVRPDSQALLPYSSLPDSQALLPYSS